MYIKKKIIPVITVPSLFFQSIERRMGVRRHYCIPIGDKAKTLAQLLKSINSTLLDSNFTDTIKRKKIIEQLQRLYPIIDLALAAINQPTEGPIWHPPRSTTTIQNGSSTFQHWDVFSSSKESVKPIFAQLLEFNSIAENLNTLFQDTKNLPDLHTYQFKSLAFCKAIKVSCVETIPLPPVKFQFEKNINLKQITHKINELKQFTLESYTRHEKELQTFTTHNLPLNRYESELLEVHKNTLKFLIQFCKTIHTQLENNVVTENPREAILQAIIGLKEAVSQITSKTRFNLCIETEEPALQELTFQILGDHPSPTPITLLRIKMIYNSFTNHKTALPTAQLNLLCDQMMKNHFKG